MPLQTTTSACLPATALEHSLASGWNLVCQITYNPDAWVKLLQPPSEYGFDEANYAVSGIRKYLSRLGSRLW